MADVLSNYVKFLRGTPEAYSKCRKDPDTLYFVSVEGESVGQLWIGDKLITMETTDDGILNYLHELADVDTSGLKQGCVLTWSDAKQKWVVSSIEDAIKIQLKPHRKAVMQTYGADVTPSPSDTTVVGRKILEMMPETSGSLGCAISEAVEVARNTPGARYVLGSVLNHVLLHQSIIGLEAKAALDKYGVKPDIIIGCAGGGSNLGGLIAPFMADRLEGKNNARFIAVEPSSCPSLSRGKYAYDYGDTGKTTPLMKMYTLGSGFIPASNHVGGLRYHGMNPIVSKLYDDGYMEARSYTQTRIFGAATQFARVEGTLPAPESSHAICCAMEEALKCKETGEKKVILFGLTGTGYFDMPAYQSFYEGTMQDYIPTDAELEQGFATLPEIE